MIKKNIKKIVDTRALPIIIVGVDSYRGAVDLQIGDNFASITEPKLHFLDEGLVYIETNGRSTASWEDILPERGFGRTVLRGFSDDPRLVQIGFDVLGGKFTQSSIGHEIPPCN
ncbi:MAG: hypothetical protein LBF49_02525 [Puniceicoccales bacterium]|jgi:hypothetical protein|nr:hypothetical protein [Puniceicoccales bacterium]